MKNIKDLDKNLSILVIDDYPAVRRIVKNCLAKLGFKNIVEAENGSQALDKIHENKFDLVISDFEMPDMPVDTLMEKVNVSSAHVPFIMLVTPQQNESISKKVPAENTDYVVKPFTVGVLENKISSLLCRPRSKDNESPSPLWFSDFIEKTP